MRILDALNPLSAGGARSRQLARQDGVAFRERMKKLAPLRAAGWRQLLRLNREAQVDPWITPPTAPPGYAAADAAGESAQLRRIVAETLPLLEQQPPDGLQGRREAVARMLELLDAQQQAQEEIAARGARAAAHRSGPR